MVAEVSVGQLVLDPAIRLEASAAVRLRDLRELRHVVEAFDVDVHRTREGGGSGIPEVGMEVIDVDPGRRRPVARRVTDAHQDVRRSHTAGRGAATADAVRPVEDRGQQAVEVRVVEADENGRRRVAGQHRRAVERRDGHREARAELADGHVIAVRPD